MPRLPVAQDLGVRSFQDRSSVVTPSVDGRAQDAFVATISNISSGMNSRLDASSLHKAKIHFQKAKLDADTAFDQDPDFETYQERYDKKLESAVAESAAMVRNPRDQEAFRQDMSLYRAQGTEQIIAKAFGKEVDKGLADLNETLTIGRENYLRASNQQDKDFAVQTSNAAIDAAEQSTHIDADKAQSLRQNLALDLAVASIEVAPPEKQIKLLKSRSGVMEYMPLDVRTEMLKNAETQLGAQITLDTSNAIRVEGGTLEERMAKVNKIKDPEIKGPVRSQVIADHNVELTAKGEAVYETYDRAAKGIIAGESLESFKAKHPDEWNSLGSKEQAALISMTQSKKEASTDLGTYHQLNILKQKDKVEAYHFFLDNVAAFSTADAKKQSDYFTGLAEQPKALFSMDKTFSDKVKGLGLSGAALGDATYRIQEEFETWAKANPGETMSLDAQTKIVDSVFDKVVGTSTWWLGSDKRGFEVPKNKVDASKLQEKIKDFEVRYGKPPDPDMQLRIRDKMVKDGLISDYSR